MRFDMRCTGMALVLSIPGICMAQSQMAKESVTSKSTGDTKDEKFKLTDLEQQVLDWANAQRKASGLPEFVASEKLTKAARWHAYNMATYNSLSHSLGGDVGSRVAAYGYSWGRIAENIAAGQSTAEDVTRSWMGSNGHRANILGGFLEIGIGIADSPYGTRYWAQIFGNPGG